MMNHRNSKQRNIIREYLHGRTDHPCAEKLYNEIREQYPRMSLGTVYRNLMYLKDIGEIQSIDVGDGVSHFDPNPKPHVHFYCTKCHQVSDIFIDDYERFKTVFSRYTHAHIEKCNINLEGICDHCQILSEKDKLN